MDNKENKIREVLEEQMDEFDKIFEKKDSDIWDLDPVVSTKDGLAVVGKERIDSFLKEAQTQFLKAVIEEMKEMKRQRTFIGFEHLSNEQWKHHSGILDGYNQALSDFKIKLQQAINKD